MAGMDGLFGILDTRLDKVEAQLALHHEVLASQLAEKAEAAAYAKKAAEDKTKADKITVLPTKP